MNVYSLEVATDICDCVAVCEEYHFLFPYRGDCRKADSRILIAAIETLFAYPLNSD